MNSKFDITDGVDHTEAKELGFSPVPRYLIPTGFFNIYTSEGRAALESVDDKWTIIFSPCEKVEIDEPAEYTALDAEGDYVWMSNQDIRICKIFGEQNISVKKIDENDPPRIEVEMTMPPRFEYVDVTLSFSEDTKNTTQFTPETEKKMLQSIVEDQELTLKTNFTEDSEPGVMNYGDLEKIRKENRSSGGDLTKIKQKLEKLTEANWGKPITQKMALDVVTGLEEEGVNRNEISFNGIPVGEIILTEQTGSCTLGQIEAVEPVKSKLLHEKQVKGIDVDLNMVEEMVALFKKKYSHSPSEINIPYPILRCYHIKADSSLPDTIMGMKVQYRNHIDEMMVSDFDLHHFYTVSESDCREENKNTEPRTISLEDFEKEINSNPDRYNIGGNCPHCGEILPSQLVAQIESGKHDCPVCGKSANRCKLKGCNGLLFNSYNIQTGKFEKVCQDCGNKDE